MKIVSENISEKFREESDPIQDIGIGVYQIWKKGLNELFSHSGRSSKTLYLLYFKQYCPDIFNESGYVQITRTILHTLARVVNLGLSPEKSYKQVRNEEFWHDRDLPLQWKKMLQSKILEILSKKYFMDIDLKKDVNERFDDQSDPIKDMRIGQSRYKHLLLDLIPKKAPILYGQYHDVANFLRSIIEDDRVTVKVNDNVMTILGGEVWLKSFASDLTACVNIYVKAIRDIQYSSEDNTVTVIFNHSLKESLNEKFKEDSDPIQDMGIGTYAMYINLKRGDVLEFTKKLQMNNTGYVYPEGTLITVNCKPEWWNAQKRFTTSHYRNIQDLKNDKPASWERNNMEWHMDYDFFQEYLIRIGNRKINEKFEEESDPVNDLGIGVRNLIKNSPEKIFRLDNKKVEAGECFIYDDKKKLEGTMIKEIAIREDCFYFNLYSDEFVSAPHTYINKLKYCKTLIKEIGMAFLFDKVSKHPSPKTGKATWGVSFMYKEDTAQYFKDYIGNTTNGFK